MFWFNGGQSAYAVDRRVGRVANAREGTRLGNELDQQVPTIIEMELGQVNVEFEQDQDGTLRVTGIPFAVCRA